MKKTTRSIIRTVPAVILLLASVLTMGGCRSKAPKTEEIYDRVVELIEAAYEVNAVLYGVGLPCYDRGSPIYATMYNDYETMQYTKDYNIVSSHAKYGTIDRIKQAAEKIYTKDLLEKTVYPTVFTGLVVSGVNGVPQYAPATYLENENRLYMLATAEPMYRSPLIYDYSTMKVIQPSNAQRVILSLTAWEEDSPESPITAQVILALSDGVWLLDKLTV